VRDESFKSQNGAVSYTYQRSYVGQKDRRVGKRKRMRKKMGIVRTGPLGRWNDR